MITETSELKRNQQIYWKRSGSFSECYFQRLHVVERQGLEPLKAVTIKYSGEEHILKPEELYPTYKDMFCDKHKGILQALIARGKESMAAISKRLVVPYSRVLNVNKQAKELGIIHAKETQTI